MIKNISLTILLTKTENLLSRSKSLVKKKFTLLKKSPLWF